MATNYTEPSYDDTVCAGCGAPLPVEPGHPDTWDFHGFCHAGCAVAAGDCTLTGAPAVEMAERACQQGGPGFEQAIVRNWIAGAVAHAPVMLTCSSADADTVGGSPQSWCWRLYSGGICRAMRLTPKGTRA